MLIRSRSQSPSRWSSCWSYSGDTLWPSFRFCFTAWIHRSFARVCFARFLSWKCAKCCLDGPGIWTEWLLHLFGWPVTLTIGSASDNRILIRAPAHQLSWYWTHSRGTSNSWACRGYCDGPKKLCGSCFDHWQGSHYNELGCLQCWRCHWLSWPCLWFCWSRQVSDGVPCSCYW